MKLGVMADSHDNVPKVKQAVELFNARSVDLVIHAGDFVAPFAVVPLGRLESRVVAVFGNNDGERVGLAAKFGEIGGEVHPNLAPSKASRVAKLASQTTTGSSSINGSCGTLFGSSLLRNSPSATAPRSSNAGMSCSRNRSTTGP